MAKAVVTADLPLEGGDVRQDRGGREGTLPHAFDPHLPAGSHPQ